MDILYRLIVLFFTVLVVRHLFREKNVWNQAGAVLLLVLLVLRLFMVK